jgi:Leucine-rich repeat (LRR) protein
VHAAGSIPAGLSALTALTLMDLNTNQLNSTLPPDLAGLRALRELYVDNNLLQGPLPESLLSLQQTWYAPEKRLMSSFDFPERQDVVDTPIRSPLYSEVRPAPR